MKFPIYGKIKNVPNHQPDGDLRRKNAGVMDKQEYMIVGCV